VTTAADAVLAALRGALPVDVQVYDGLVPGVPPPLYVVAYIPAGWRQSSDITAVSEDVSLSFQTITVASDTYPAYSAAKCRWLVGAVQEALTDLVITADGWAPALIQHEGSQSPQPDETTPEKKVYATDQFSLRTVRI
jgi:hypothetical protein